MANDLHVSDLLAVAARRLARSVYVRDGGGQGPDSHCPVDVVGAVAYACHGTPEVFCSPRSEQVCEAVCDHLGVGVGFDESAVDVIGRLQRGEAWTKERAVAVLRDAADALEPTVGLS